MFASAEFWVFVAFLLFLGIFGKKAYYFLVQALDDHRKKVTDQIHEAQRLYDEAQSLLETYQKKHDAAVEQAKKIISFAEEEAAQLKKVSLADFDRYIASKEKALEERLAVEQAEAVTHLREQALQDAVKIIEQYLSENPKEKQKITASSLKEISKVSLKSER